MHYFTNCMEKLIKLLWSNYYVNVIKQHRAIKLQADVSRNLFILVNWELLLEIDSSFQTSWTVPMIQLDTNWNE